MNELAKIQLFRIGATLPYAEVETTLHNIRVIHYEGSEENAKKTILVMSPEDAADIAKAINVIFSSYAYEGEIEK